MEQLKPCKCGNKYPRLVGSYSGHGKKLVFKSCFVECDECFTSVEKKSFQLVIEAWNRRADNSGVKENDK